jgi:hypothetical protein
VLSQTGDPLSTGLQGLQYTPHLVTVVQPCSRLREGPPAAEVGLEHAAVSVSAWMADDHPRAAARLVARQGGAVCEASDASHEPAMHHVTAVKLWQGFSYLCTDEKASDA